MPKKKQKPREQKIAEEYFPLDETDIKYAIEKPYKPLTSEIVIETRKPKKKTYKKKSARKTTKKSSKKFKKNSKQKIDFKPPKIKLKKSGYELVITEKPQAALKISSALGKSVKKNLQGVPYYEVQRDGKQIVVACTVGHLLTLKQNSTNSNGAFPIFDIKWVPNYLARTKDFTKKYYLALSKLVKDAESITIATDYDIEGEVIGLNTVRYICGQEDANRMKFSTLTNSELNKAYENKSPNINWGLAVAGETRHYLDWFYGINLSRALMDSIKKTGRFKIMSIGRVQGPALNLIVQKEKKIQNFKPKTYWQIFIKLDDFPIELKHNKDIFKKQELQKFEKLKGKKAKAKTEKKEQSLPPNPPFNLTALQMESYKLYGITPARTLQIAQSLYLSGLISYPRTSSQKLPPSINYKSILKKLSKEYKVEHLIKKDKPLEGKKTDPAHPSIYPTAQNQNSVKNKDEQKIYDLIVKRFLALFCENAVIENKKIKAKINIGKDNVNNKNNLERDGEHKGRSGDENILTFSTKGSSIRKKSWLEFYPAKLKETQIPDLNGNFEIKDIRIEEKETQPPKRYTQASIVSELEKKNLGTKCLTGDTKVIFNGKTISLENIFKIGKKQSIEKGIKVREINGKTISLEKNSPKIKNTNYISKRKIRKDENIIQIETGVSKIRLTNNHLVYVYKKNNLLEMPAKEIKIEDKLCGLTRRYEEGKKIVDDSLFKKDYKIKDGEILHRFSSKGDKGISTKKLPVKWTTHLAWLLGYYYGDGSYDGPEYNDSHSISFSTTKKKAVNQLKEYTKEIFGNECYCYSLGTKYKVNLNSVMSYVLIKAFPELNRKKIFKIPNQFVGDFLRGFFDADGNVHLRPKEKTKIKNIDCNSFDTPRIKFTLGNERLIKWVRDLLEIVGIKAKINKGYSSCNGRKFDCWTILISGRDKIEKFAYAVGFDSYKEDILYKGLKCASPKYKILKNSALIYMSLNKKEQKIEGLLKNTNLPRYELIIALRRLLNLDIISKKRYTNRNKYIYSLKEKNQDYLNHCIKLIYKKVHKDVYEIPIKKISLIKYNNYVYDLSVNKVSPNFLAEGNVLVHNSTRANIIETLYNRSYVKERSIKATPLGISLIFTLEKHSPIIIDEQLTKQFEKDMDSITQSKSNFKGKEEKIIEKAKKTIKKISKDFEIKGEEIGEELVKANEKLREQEREENKLNTCPICEKGNLAIMYSKKTKRYFVACNAYPECKNTYTLPPNGTIKKTDKFCEKCEWPILMRLSKGKRPWEFCFNPECPINKKRLEEYKKKKETNSNNILEYNNL